MMLYDCDSGDETEDHKVTGSAAKNPPKFSLIENQVYKKFSGVGEDFIEEDLEKKKSYFQQGHNTTLNDPNELLVTYENLEIRAADMIRLAPNTFLNDTVVNFFIKVFSDKLVSKDAKKEVHVFNTYFFKSLDKQAAKLAKELTQDRAIWQKVMSEGFKSISRSHKSVDIFAKKHLFIPIHRGGHWSSLIVANFSTLVHALEKGLKIESLNERMRPSIIYLDPLWKAQRDTGEIIRMYLEAALQSKLDLVYERRLQEYQQAGGFLVTQTTLPDFQAILPRQQNTSDCGLYILEYMESFCSNSASFFLSLYSRNHCINWFPATLIQNKRVMLANIIIRRTNQAHWEAIIQEYLNEREFILSKIVKDPTEYDSVDFLKLLSVGRQEAAEEYYDTLPQSIIQCINKEAEEIMSRTKDASNKTKISDFFN